MTLSQRIEIFAKFGEILLKKLRSDEDFNVIINELQFSNPFFTPLNVKFAIENIAGNLTFENLKNWVSLYSDLQNFAGNQKIGVILAGNIPLVGFNDFLCVLISGNIFIGKMSSKDEKLLEIFANFLIEIEPSFAEKIYFEKKFLKNFDKIIATGNNNSARYFEYYFGKYPNVIRKNRTSVAVLSGKESEEELLNLADDIFLYFGLGCRNVGKLFVPQGFDVKNLFEKYQKTKFFGYRFHNRYANNYDYRKAIFLMNQEKFFDLEFVLLQENTNLFSPTSVIFYEYYNEINEVKRKIESFRESIQCVVSNIENFDNKISFGEAQKPKLSDYSDNIDTLKFLIS